MPTIEQAWAKDCLLIRQLVRDELTKQHPKLFDWEVFPQWSARQQIWEVLAVAKEPDEKDPPAFFQQLIIPHKDMATMTRAQRLELMHEKVRLCLYSLTLRTQGR